MRDNPSRKGRIASPRLRRFRTLAPLSRFRTQLHPLTVASHQPRLRTRASHCRCCTPRFRASCCCRRSVACRRIARERWSRGNGNGNLRVKMVIDWALKKFKMSGGHMKMKRYEPLWKSMKCPQQSGSVDDGFFVMRFMYDIVNRSSTASDFETVWILQNEQPYTYGEDDMNELRDKWATYFTNRCST